MSMQNPTPKRRDLEHPATQTRKPHVTTIRAVDLLGKEIPPVRWAVPDLLPEGVTLLAGKPKLGKSWMVLDLCVAVATGGIVLGTRRVEQGDALYLGLEDNERRLQRRLRKLLRGDSRPERLEVAWSWPRANEGGIENLHWWLEDHPECRLVVIDTLSRFKPRTGHAGKRSQYDEDREAVDPLAPIASEHNVSVLVVHHLREMESDDPLDMITGSVGLTSGVDGALVLKRQRGNANAFLHVDGRDIEESKELPLVWDAASAKWTETGEAEEYRRSETRQEILKVLEEADEPLGPRQIAERTGLDENVVRQRLHQMSKAGEVKQVARGRYAHHNDRNNRNGHQKDVTDVMDVMGGS
jgi:hypothetical protein